MYLTPFTNHEGHEAKFEAFVKASSRYDAATKTLVAFGYLGGLAGAAVLSMVLATNTGDELLYANAPLAAALYAGGAALICIWCVVALIQRNRARAEFNDSLHSRWSR